MSEERAMIGDCLQAALETVYPEAVYPNVYVGDAVEYVVWNRSIIPAVWAEGAPHAARYLIQVHLYAPRGKNVTASILALDRALWDAGFTWPSVTDVSDEDGQHWELLCEGCDGGPLYGYT